MSGSLKPGIDMLLNGQWPEAQAFFAKVIKRKPKDHAALHYYGVAAGRTGDYEQSKRSIEKAIKLKPKISEYHHNIASTYRVLGLFDEAENAYKRSIELNPNYAEAYFNYSATRKFKEDDPIFEQIASLLKKEGNLNDEERGFLHFAAGKVYDDIKDFDTAFDHYEKGNQSRNHIFDHAEHNSFIEKLKSVFTKDFLKSRIQAGHPSDLPIFVVGMPRSGTTLVEQILSSHSTIEGAGELGDISAIADSLENYADGVAYPESAGKCPPNAPAGMANHYLGLRKKEFPSEKVKHVVDKMPNNFLHLGLLALMFPNAKIVHCIRDPRDTCLSCFFQRFRSSHEYASSLDDLAFYYNKYREIMAYWHENLPGKIYDLHYGRLVEDQESETRKLIEFIGVHWEDSCLQFHETNRPVTTASNWQVRRPMNKQGMARWQRCEAHIAPLVEALGL